MKKKIEKKNEKKIRSENFRAEIFCKVFENFLLRTLGHSLVNLGGGEWYPTGEAVMRCYQQDSPSMTAPEASPHRLI